MPVAKRESVLTPVVRVGDIWLKRDDLWQGEAPARGGKARTAEVICRTARALGIEELCSAHDRNSSVPGMLARVCRHYGVSLRLWLPAAKDPLPPVFAEAKQCGAVLEEVRPGYMSVRQKRMRDYAEASGGRATILGIGLNWRGCGIAETQAAAANVAALHARGAIRRVVCPVGSGGMLAGIAAGLGPACPILGVCVGGTPAATYPPNVTLVAATKPFHADVRAAIGPISLDPAYEAKCAEFLQAGDLLWIVAHRDTQ